MDSDGQKIKDKKHPLEKTLEHAIKINLTDLAAVLEKNLQNNISTFIHLKCWDKSRNRSRPKRRFEKNEPHLSKHPAKRSDAGAFNFKAQVFIVKKHPRQIFVTLTERHLKLIPQKTQKSILVLLRYVVVEKILMQRILKTTVVSMWFSDCRSPLSSSI